MPTSTVHLFGGACNGMSRRVTYAKTPPIELGCGGDTYHLEPDASGALNYVTADYTRDHAAPGRIVGERDVFRSWHRLLHTLDHAGARSRGRIARARRRIRRAVR